MDNLMTPPYSMAAEQAVLGAILINNEVSDDVFALIDADDFYNVVNRSIFGNIKRLIKLGKTVDVIMLSNEVQDIELSYAIELVQVAPSEANAIQYAKKVKNDSTLRRLIAAGVEIQEIGYHSKEEIEQVVCDCERAISEVINSISTTDTDNSICAILTETVEWLEELNDSGDELLGISTGFSDLDELINGLKNSTMIVLAARPAMGKTTLALNMVEAEAMRGGNPLVFSIEMPRKQLMLKIISSNQELSISDLQRVKSMGDFQWAQVSEAIKALKKTNLEIIDNGGITTDQIRLETRRYQKKYGKPTLVMVDYLQLIKPAKAENRTQEISQISRDLKNLSKEFDCPVLVLSQLSRGVEQRADKRPMNSDLRESGQIEQDAEEIIFIYRDEVYNKGSNDVGRAEIIVSKCRMGRIGTVGTNFKGQFSKFSSFKDGDELKAKDEAEEGDTLASRFGGQK